MYLVLGADNQRNHTGAVTRKKRAKFKHRFQQIDQRRGSPAGSREALDELLDLPHLDLLLGRDIRLFLSRFLRHASRTVPEALDHKNIDF